MVPSVALNSNAQPLYNTSMHKLANNNKQYQTKKNKIENKEKLNDATHNLLSWIEWKYKTMHIKAPLHRSQKESAMRTTMFSQCLCVLSAFMMYSIKVFFFSNALAVGKITKGSLRWSYWYVRYKLWKVKLTYYFHAACCATTGTSNLGLTYVNHMYRDTKYVVTQFEDSSCFLNVFQLVPISSLKRLPSSFVVCFGIRSG